MRICVVTFEYPPEIGGIAHSAERITKGLARKGLDIHVVVVSLSKQVSVSSYNAEQELWIHRFGPFTGNLKCINERESKELESFLHQLHNNYQFDLFHAFTIYPCGYLVTKVAEELDRPVIISARGEDGHIDLEQKELEPKFQWAVDHCSSITFVSKPMMESVDRKFPCLPKAKVILNSIDPSNFYYLKNFEPCFDKKKLKGTIVGLATTIRETKGFEFLLEAFATFSAKYPSTLLLAGGFRTPELKKKYEQMISALDIENKVVITGPVQHKYILNYTNLIDIYVMPSLSSEGCPNSLLEAMWLGKPVVASAVGAIPDVITSEVNGILVKPKSVKDLFEYIQHLELDKNLCESLGKKARSTIREKFNLNRELKQWYELYTGLMQLDNRKFEQFLAPHFDLKFVMIEPTNRCNLKCPLCPTGSGEIKPKKDMSLETFKNIIDQLPPGKPEICLWNFGEPLLHKDIFSMIDYAEEKGHKTILSSNVSFLTEKTVNNILDSRLSKMIVCLDGVSAETYLKYRQRGNFEKTLSTITSLCELKRKRNQKSPFIELQFIIMKHNEHEVEAIQKLAEEIGADTLALKTVSVPPEKEEQFLPTKSEFSRMRKPEDTTFFCTRPWDSIVINCDGNVMPCCYAHHKEEYVLGNVLKTSLKEIWRGRHYQSFRKRHLLSKKEISICKNCNGHKTKLYTKKYILKKP